MHNYHGPFFPFLSQYPTQVTRNSPTFFPRRDCLVKDGYISCRYFRRHTEPCFKGKTNKSYN
uniref:Uncharacterized protein n=1 Tax=Arundo donax TaxID=35708 RepID=A0A0A8Y1T7_ARUDO